MSSTQPRRRSSPRSRRGPTRRDGPGDDLRLRRGRGLGRRRRLRAQDGRHARRPRLDRQDRPLRLARVRFVAASGDGVHRPRPRARHAGHRRAAAATCRACVDACPADAGRDVQWTAGMPRDALFDEKACEIFTERYDELGRRLRRLSWRSARSGSPGPGVENPAARHRRRVADTIRRASARS